MIVLRAPSFSFLVSLSSLCSESISQYLSPPPLFFLPFTFLPLYVLFFSFRSPPPPSSSSSLFLFLFFAAFAHRRRSSECFVDRNGTTQGSDVVQPPETSFAAVRNEFSATGTYTRNLKVKISIKRDPVVSRARSAAGCRAPPSFVLCSFLFFCRQYRSRGKL